VSSLLPSSLVLGLAAIAALLLALRRRSPPHDRAGRVAAARALALAVGVQGVHFCEEAATGFHERLGALLGLPGLPFAGFLVFNLAWLGIWIASVPGLRSAHRCAFFAAWFLAIAGMANGIAHPLLAVAAAGYFPGLISSPLIGVAAVRLWRALHRATRAGRLDDPVRSAAKGHTV
jgi:hypothetical protein